MNAPIVARALLLLLLLTAGAAYAQEIEPAPSYSLSSEESMFDSMDRPNSFYAGMPSPTAASLGKFSDVPVSLYTGMAQISIPLYELKGRVLSLPIVLNYHASGVKVEEIPGWAGLGWSLDAGGVITRSVRGLPDDQADGYINGGGTTLQSNLSNPGNQYLRNVSNRLSGADGWPYTPMPESWNIGLLLEKAECNAQSQPVAKTATTHANGTTYGQTINALIAAYDLFQGALFTHNTYAETTGWTHPTSETVTHYNETGSASFTGTRSFTYNADYLQLTSVTETNSDNTILIHTAVGSRNLYQWYEYDRMSRLVKAFVETTSTKPSVAAATYAYNPTNTTRSLRFDASGSSSLLALPYAYNLRDWITDIGSITSTAYPFSAKYAYHANGNVSTAEFYNGGVASSQKRYRQTYASDAMNRISSGTYAFWTGSSYITSSNYLVNGITYDRNGNIKTLALAGRLQGCTQSYYDKDHLSSTRAAMTAAGTVIGARDYYPFGLEMPGRTYLNGTAANERFTGKERDG